MCKIRQKTKRRNTRRRKTKRKEEELEVINRREEDREVEGGIEGIQKCERRKIKTEGKIGNKRKERRRKGRKRSRMQSISEKQKTEK